MIAGTDNDVFLSAASSWEIAIKYTLGKLLLPERPDRFVPVRLERDSISALPIQHSHALAVGDLPLIHRDPFRQTARLSGPPGEAGAHDL